MQTLTASHFSGVPCWLLTNQFDYRARFQIPFNHQPACKCFSLLNKKGKFNNSLGIETSFTINYQTMEYDFRNGCRTINEWNFKLPNHQKPFSIYPFMDRLCWGTFCSRYFFSLVFVSPLMRPKWKCFDAFNHNIQDFVGKPNLFNLKWNSPFFRFPLRAMKSFLFI